MASLKYKGNGAFLPGVPARDLTENEVKRHGKDMLLSSGLYVEIKADPKPAKEKGDK